MEDVYFLFFDVFGVYVNVYFYFEECFCYGCGDVVLVCFGFGYEFFFVYEFGEEGLFYVVVCFVGFVVEEVFFLRYIFVFFSFLLSFFV